MRILLFIPFFLLILSANAQNRDKIVDVGPEYKALFNEFDDCLERQEQNCIEIINRIIEKGKQETVPFLDYLYGRKAFYFWNRQELDSTMVYSQLSIQNLNPDKKQRRDVDSYNLLANCYYFKGDLNTALKYYLKIAAILEDGGNPLNLGYLYINIGTLLGETGNDDKQIEYLLKSYKLLEENNDERFIATTSSNLALGYYHKKDTINAKKWSEKSLELSELSNDLVAKTLSYVTLSLIEKGLNKSLLYAEQSVKYADELGDRIHMASAYYRYAAALDKLGKSKEALSYAEQAVNFAKEVGDNVTLTKASYTAATIYFNLGMKEKSADFYRTYSIFKDSISSAENAKEINEIQTKYQTEKKEKKITEQELKIQKQRSNLLYALLGSALLVSVLGGIFIYNRKAQKLKLKQLQQEKENAILNSFILGEERERKRISQDLHDGVAAMIGAAKMSLESIPYLSKEKQMEQFSKVKQILENTHADVRHIAHNLLPTVLEKEGLIKATSHFISEINETKLVKISITDKSSKAEELSPKLQLMLFRVIQELVNNIIKHSQAQNAEIAFSNSPNGLQIEISDDGIGYEDTNDTGHQGLYSITKRLKSIGGNFKIIKGKSGGTQANVVVVV
ncbi:tetratricopeptide repeat-containing sensor histidine kinase [Bizionia sp.]|uniref:tetratricopeptide repeat-containing sensor histidine kinase n=1 Tax=Bizionia sp. TaxID=1954480 RepID=UPI003A8CEABF